MSAVIWKKEAWSPSWSHPAEWILLLWLSFYLIPQWTGWDSYHTRHGICFTHQFPWESYAEKWLTWLNFSVNLTHITIGPIHLTIGCVSGSCFKMCCFQHSMKLQSPYGYIANTLVLFILLNKMLFSPVPLSWLYKDHGNIFFRLRFCMI